MALTTFSDSTAIDAGDVNDNFQDEENAEATAKSGYLVTQRYRLGVKDLSTLLPVGRRSLIIKPIGFVGIYTIDVYIDDGSNTQSLAITLECLTSARALNNKTQSASVGSGESTPHETTVSFEGTPTVLLPGNTYRLTLAGTGTAIDWTEVVITGYRPRSNH